MLRVWYGEQNLGWVWKNVLFGKLPELGLLPVLALEYIGRFLTEQIIASSAASYGRQNEYLLILNMVLLEGFSS